MRLRTLFAAVPAAALVSGLLPASPTDAAEPPARYVVVLSDGTTLTPDAAAGRAASLGAEIRHVYRHTIRGYAADLTDAEARLVGADPAVASIHRDGVARTTTTQVSPPWGLDRIDQRVGLSGTYTYFATGAGVTAYVIDSGIRTTHADFGGRATWGYDVYGAYTDCNGHGTHVAGTVGGTTYGVAKQVSLVAVRVLDCGGFGSYTDVIAGVDWVTGDHLLNRRGPAVANMSLGGTAFPPLDAAVSASIASGISYSVSAGNSAANACLFSPARVPEAMTLAASDANDDAAWFTNKGPCVDWYAPGVDVVSAYRTSNTATASLSGTSMASPHNAGVAALYLQSNPLATPHQVYLALADRVTLEVVDDGSTDSTWACSPPGPVCDAFGEAVRLETLYTQQDHLLFTDF